MVSGYAFTLCKVADRGRSAAKRFVGKDDGSYEEVPYSRITHWFFKPWRIGTNTGMAAFLRKAAQRPDLMIVMGDIRPGLDLHRPQLRRWVDPDPQNNALMEIERAWLAIDADGYGVPAPWGLAPYLADSAAAVRDDALGEDFAGVECVVAATSKTGLVGEETARLRLFFQLDRVYQLTDLRRWAVGARAADLPVDPAVMQAGQPIYTARPRFQGTLKGRDPVPPHMRAFVLPAAKAGDVRVALDIHRYDQPSREIAEHMRNAGGRCGGDWRALLQATLGGPAGFHEPLKQGLGIAAHLPPEADAEICGLIADLLAQRADHGRQRQYSERWVRDTLRSFRRRDKAAAGVAAQAKTAAMAEQRDQLRQWFKAAAEERIALLPQIEQQLREDAEERIALMRNTKGDDDHGR